MAFSVSFSGDTLLYEDNNASSFLVTGVPLPVIPVATGIAYAASLGNAASDTVVQVDAGGGADTIFLTDFFVEVGGD